MVRAERLDRRIRRRRRVPESDVTRGASNSWGLLPSPSELASYDRVQKGTVDRILRIVEAELAHRRTLESQRMETYQRCEYVKAVCTCLIILSLFLGSVPLVPVGADAAGYVGILVALLRTHRRLCHAP